MRMRVQFSSGYYHSLYSYCNCHDADSGRRAMAPSTAAPATVHKADVVHHVLTQYTLYLSIESGEVHIPNQSADSAPGEHRAGSGGVSVNQPAAPRVAMGCSCYMSCMRFVGSSIRSPAAIPRCTAPCTFRREPSREGARRRSP